MSTAIERMAGISGCDSYSAAGVYTPSGRHAGSKIVAIGVEVAANITNFKYTNLNGVVITVTSDNWIGRELNADGTNSYIPLGVRADSVELASGTIKLYFG